MIYVSAGGAEGTRTPDPHTARGCACGIACVASAISPSFPEVGLLLQIQGDRVMRLVKTKPSAAWHGHPHDSAEARLPDRRDLDPLSGQLRYGRVDVVAHQV